MIFRNLSILGFAFVLPPLAASMDLKIDSIKVGSVIYTNVVIIKVNPADIYFAHTGGMVNVKLRQLDPRLQRKLNYDPNQAVKAEVDRAMSDEEYKLRSVQNFHQRIAQERAEAISNAAPPFSLSDPINAQSPLNKPTPSLGPVRWVSEKPPQAADKFKLAFFWNNDSPASSQTIPTLNAISKSHSDRLIVTGFSSNPETELKDLEGSIQFYYGSDPTDKYAAALGITSVPTVALIDPKGIVRYIGHPAALTDEALDKLISRYAAD